MFIIAYGSLMNQFSLESTLGRPTTLKKLVVPNVKRVFNAPFSGFAYLNLAAAPGSSIEAGCFTIEPTELTKFDIREAGSVLQEVAPGYFAFVWPEESTQYLPVLQSYLDVCRNGAKELQISWKLGLVRPGAVINDRLAPQYQPIYAKKSD